MSQVCPYWTAETLAWLDKAPSFAAVGEIAMQVLKRMARAKTNEPISQLCGPISTGGMGCMRQNALIFARAVEELRRQKLNPFDQTPMQAVMERLISEWQRAERGYCHKLLTTVYEPLFRSGIIKKAVFLPGWDDSVGATWEHSMATECGITIHDFPQRWHNKIMIELAPSLFLNVPEPVAA